MLYKFLCLIPSRATALFLFLQWKTQKAVLQKGSNILYHD